MTTPRQCIIFCTLNFASLLLPENRIVFVAITAINPRGERTVFHLIGNIFVSDGGTCFFCPTKCPFDSRSLNIKKLYLPLTLWLLSFLNSIQIINVSRN